MVRPQFLLPTAQQREHVLRQGHVHQPVHGDGRRGQAVEEFNADNFDHSKLGFIGGGIIWGRQTGNGPVRGIPLPKGAPKCGLHGAERRDANGDLLRVGFGDERLLKMEHVLEQVVGENPGMLLEIKGAALALHYRNAPTREAAARRAAEQLVERFADGYVLQPGKMVFEIKPKNVDKGRAIAAFLDEPPFAARRPVFAGDDLTDEKGFAVVNQRQGVAIKVGAGDTIAPCRVESVGELLDWIARIVAGAVA
ncbi:MAG: trehalose-phosphatase [Pararobbsia sp.]